MGENGHYQLIAALRPFVHEEESRIESFLEEDLEWFVEAIEAFGGRRMPDQQFQHHR